MTKRLLQALFDDEELAAIQREALSNDYPTGGIETLNEDIERGYLEERRAT